MRIQSQQRFRQHVIRDMPRRRLHGSGPAEKPTGRVFHPGVLDSQTVRADGGVEDPPGAGADDVISMGRGGEVEDLLICVDHDGAYLPGIGGEARGEGDVGTGLGCTKDERSWDVAALPCRCHARFPLSILGFCSEWTAGDDDSLSCYNLGIRCILTMDPGRISGWGGQDW